MPIHRLVLLPILALMVLGNAACAGGETAPQPAWIADAAGVLTAQQEADLTDLLTQFEERTTVQLVGVTVEETADLSVEGYTRRLAGEWEIGVAGVNNGVMVLVAIAQRQMRIELGHGMEWTISEARAAEIVEMMVPLFREENYAQGLRAGFEQIIADNDGVAWDIAYHTLDDARRAGEAALGRIVAFEAAITGLEEDTASVAAPGVERAHLLLTDHIDPAAFSVEDVWFFHARVKEADPLVLYLLGWEAE